MEWGRREGREIAQRAYVVVTTRNMPNEHTEVGHTEGTQYCQI